MRFSPIAVMKRWLYPIRVGLGKFIIAPPVTPLWSDSLIGKAAVFVACEGIEGDYLEFGVYSGDSFVSAFDALQRAMLMACTPSFWSTALSRIQVVEQWDKMKFVAFDSFQGLPRATGGDVLSTRFVEGQFSCSEDDFLKKIRGHGIPENRTIIVPGWFKDTLNDETRVKFNLQSAAIVHIDSDLYESAKMALEFVTPLLVDGTVVIFDDWFCYKGAPFLGEQKAWNEWLASHPGWNASEYQREGPWRISFIVHRVKAM